MAANVHHNYQSDLNRLTPGARNARLGDTLYQMVNNFNLLLAHLDTANVTGIGNTNVATFTVLLPEQRTGPNVPPS
jgi:hypothetical protein